MPEGLSEIDSVNDTRSLHNRTGFTNGRRTDDERTSNYQSQYNTSNGNLHGNPGINMAPDANGNFSQEQMQVMFKLYKQMESHHGSEAGGNVNVQNSGQPVVFQPNSV